MAATSTVIDTFPGTSFSGTWFTFNAQATCANGVVITHPASNTTYAGIGTNAQYSLAGSYSVSCLTNAGNQSLVSWEVYPLQLFGGTGTDSNSQVAFYLNQGTLNVLYNNGVTQTITGGVTYNPGLHHYFLISESGGTTSWFTSPDGQHWNSFFSITDPFTETAVTIQLFAGTYASEATGTTATWSEVGGYGPITLPRGQRQAVKRAAFF